MTPHCYNRKELTGSWFANGLPIGGKPIYRWHEFTGTQDCQANKEYVAIVDGRPVTSPELMGWDCRGCRWFVPLESSR